MSSPTNSFKAGQYVWHVKRDRYVVIASTNPNLLGTGWYMVDIGDGELVPVRECDLSLWPITRSPMDFTCWKACRGHYCVCELLGLRRAGGPDLK